MKKYFKISMMLIIFGWFLFIWLVAFAIYWPDIYRAIVGIFSFSMCLYATHIYVYGINRPGFWMSQDELEQSIQDYKEARDNYIKAMRKFKENSLN
jgi:hypothetical protein